MVRYSRYHCGSNFAVTCLILNKMIMTERDKQKPATARNFGPVGAIVVIIGLLLPVILFVGLLNNWHERYPWPTVFLTIAIGLLACGFLINWEWQVNKKWVLWAFIIYAIYGLILAFWAV